jgi:hypothetical protein
VNTSDVADLFGGLSRAIPKLPKALCRQHVDVFDDETPDGIAEAVAICGRCPELDACAAWAATLAPRKLSGVIAGKHHPTPKRRNYS